MNDGPLPATDHLVDVAEPGPLVLDVVAAATPADGIALDVWHALRHVPELGKSLPGGRIRRYAAPATASWLCVVEGGDAAAARTVAGPSATGPSATGPSATGLSATGLSATAGSAPAVSAPQPLRERLRLTARPLGSRRRRDAGDAGDGADADADARSLPILYPVFFAVPEDRTAEFDRWYDDEHVPLLLRHPDWRMCRRFALADAGPAGPGSGWNRVALHYLADLRALDSPERALARDTPWRRRIQAEPWFRFASRLCYRIPDALESARPAPR